MQQFFSLLSYFCGNFYDVGNQLQNRTGTTLKIIYFFYTLRDIEDECNFVFTTLSNYYFPSFLFLYYCWLSYLEKFCDFKLIFLMTFFSAFFWLLLRSLLLTGWEFIKMCLIFFVLTAFLLDIMTCCLNKHFWVKCFRYICKFPVLKSG